MANIQAQLEVKSDGDLGWRGVVNKIVQGVGERCRVKLASFRLNR